MDELLEKCVRIMKTKSLDYAEDDDRLAEFRQTGGVVKIDMRKVLGVYINKHYRSLFKWIQGEELRGEPIEEKLSDIIVYCLLAYKIAKEERDTGFVPYSDESVDLKFDDSDIVEEDIPF